MRAAQQLAAGHPRAVAEAEQDDRLDPRLLQLVLEDRQRRDADAAADEDRARAGRRRRERAPERPGAPEPLAHTELAQATRARADVLEQELRAPILVPGDGEGAREEGPLVLASPHRAAAASIANWPGAGAGASGSATVMTR